MRQATTAKFATSVRLLPWYEAITRGHTANPMVYLLRVLLWLAQYPYLVVVCFRNFAYDSGWFKQSSVSAPVVCFGNLTVGGTGKTPAVEWAARILRDDDRRPVILSRGYGKFNGPNDEALLLEENLPDVPHLQNRDRVAVAHIAIEELESDVLLLDDGFQHRRLSRDLNIVLIDATHPPQKDYLLPRGRLREPISSLRRADAVLLTRCDQAEAKLLDDTKSLLRLRFPRLAVAETIHMALALANTQSNGEAALPPESLAGRPVALFCGIGQPSSFRATVLSLGAIIVAEQVFPDHHAYTKEDVASLAAWAKDTLPENGWLVTTQKDFVKLRIDELGGRPLWALRIGLNFLTGEQEIISLLHALPRTSEESL